MLRTSFAFVAQRIELLFATFNAGVGSLYWLALAFVLPVDGFGRMMSLQAGVLLIGLVFALRTHDLVFYAMRNLTLSLERSFRIALAIEWGTTLVSVALVVAVVELAIPELGRGIDPVWLAAYATVTGASVNQGAGTAKLRYLRRDRSIVHADLICIAFWLAALSAIPFAPRLGLLWPLVLGSLPMAVRASWLGVTSLRARGEAEVEGDSASLRTLSPSIVRYLGHGQITNFAKNGAVSLETAIVAATMGPRMVGIYRVVRGAAGLSTAALNVVYQKAFPKLVREGDAGKRRAIADRLDVNSALIHIAGIPLAAALVAGYSVAKADVASVESLLLLLGLAFALLGSPLQQGAFALLSVDGRHRAVSIGFMWSLIVLALTAVALSLFSSIWIFLVGLGAANLARLAWLRWCVRLDE